MAETSLVSIIIVNYNGKRWLKACFDSLYRQTYKNFEIIFVDNASKDNSVEFVKENYKKVKVIVNKDNLGFASGNNAGLKEAKGDFVLILNNDTWVKEDLLEKLLQSFVKIPNLCCVQPKILLAEQADKLDLCGSFWTDSTLLYHYGFHKSQTDPKYNNPMPFFSNNGACMLISKKVIDEIQILLLVYFFAFCPGQHTCQSSIFERYASIADYSDHRKQGHQ